jgi:uncharacterized membrane protein
MQQLNGLSYLMSRKSARPKGYIMRTIISFLAFGILGSGALAATVEKEVTGTAQNSFQLWSMPDESFYRFLRQSADLAAIAQCNSGTLRLSDYEMEQSVVVPSKMNVKVSARYQCDG